MANRRASRAWVRQLLAEDFSAGCREDRFCMPCAAAFCGHCCGAHHSGQGHEVVVRAEGDHQSQRGAAWCPTSSRARDSFCLTCGAGFSSAMCAHHGGHHTFRVVVFEGRYCVRCTGSEPWFHLFGNIDTYCDEMGHILVPLHPRCGGRCGGCGCCR